MRDCLPFPHLSSLHFMLQSKNWSWCDEIQMIESHVKMETYPVSMPMHWASKDWTQSSIQAMLNSSKITWKTRKTSVMAKTFYFLSVCTIQEKKRPVCRFNAVFLSPFLSSNPRAPGQRTCQTTRARSSTRPIHWPSRFLQL